MQCYSSIEELQRAGEYMKRMITDKLIAWKDSSTRKPLLVTGVRQCGKTYSILEFGREYFDDVLYLNFEQHPGYASFFSFDLDVNRILVELESQVFGKKVIPGKTLLFMDEIQKCPQAVTSLKYFCENRPDLYVICAASLLKTELQRRAVSFPVGKVSRLRMYPMNFMEFLFAAGSEQQVQELNRAAINQQLSEDCSDLLKKQLNDYFIVGGMPAAVNCWMNEQSYEKVTQIQRDILAGYEDDFFRYAPLNEAEKISWIYHSIPVQLAKDNNKFVFSHVKEGKRASELENALQWIIDAGLAYTLELAGSPELPLSLHKDASYFKVYLSDVGLLHVLSGLDYHVILEQQAGPGYKGAMTENYVMTELLSQGKNPYFWRSGNTAEVDFILEDRNHIIPLEVKAESNTMAKSYRRYCDLYHPAFGFKCSMKNVGEHMILDTRTYSIPLYLMWKLDQYIALEERK